MSTYRSLGKVPINDIYAERVKRPEEPAQSSAPTVDNAVREDEARRLRKGEPANIAFPRTKAWAAGLPRHVSVNALLSGYPRIANMLAAAWSDPAAASAYFDDLMIDRRGRRRGFSLEIQAELTALRTYYAELHPTIVSTWQAAKKRS